MPAGVVKSTHNASTFKPYDPGEAIGELSPTTPKPAKGAKCGVFGQILLAAVAIAVTVVTAGPGATLGAKIGAAVLGSTVSQGVGVATGIQDKFSFKSVALAAISAGVTHGLGDSIAPFGQVAQGAERSATAIANAAVTGAAASAITQGIATATGLQSSFSWAGVAAAGVAAGAGQGIGGKLDPLSGKGSNLTPGNIAAHTAVGAASLLASAATRAAIEGSSFSKAIEAGLPDVIGQVLGRAIGGLTEELSLSVRRNRVVSELGLGDIDPGDRQITTNAIEQMLRDGATVDQVIEFQQDSGIRSAYNWLDNIQAGGITIDQAANRIDDLFNESGSGQEYDEDGNFLGLRGTITDYSPGNEPEVILQSAVGGGVELIDSFATFAEENPITASLAVGAVSLTLGGPVKSILKRTAGEAGDQLIAAGADAFGNAVRGAVTSIATRHKWTLGLTLAGQSFEANASVIGAGSGVLGSTVVEVGLGAGAGQIVDRVKDLRAKALVRDKRGYRPPNHQYAGSVFPASALPAGIRGKYPNGVAFNQRGFPDFTPYRKFRTEKFKFTNHPADVRKAEAQLKAAGLSRPTDQRYAWHHNEEGFMELVPFDLHRAVNHIGGNAIKP